MNAIELLSKVSGISKPEIRDIMLDVQEDHLRYPLKVRNRQLKDAGWESDPSETIWLPPKGTVPYRPYQRYSAWKQMQKMSQEDNEN